MWRTDLYIAEAKRQLADHRFYEKIPSDATQNSQQEVESFIYAAIESNQPSAFSSSHPYSCKSSIPCNKFLRLRKMCSDDANSDIEAAKRESFFAARGYPNDLVRRRRGRASTNSRTEILKSDAPNNNANDNVPIVTL